MIPVFWFTKHTCDRSFDVNVFKTCHPDCDNNDKLISMIDKNMNLVFILLTYINVGLDLLKILVERGKKIFTVILYEKIYGLDEVD